MNDPLLGSQIAHYRVERVLGRGGMASVYFAWDTQNNRPVALKVMDERYRGTPSYVDRFIQEAQTIASWDHLNIVHVLDAGEENDIYYYAMEFIRGMDLAQLLRQYLNAGQLMPYNEVVRLGWAVANALDFAHAHGIIHRDIKPSNVLISVDGRVLLSDFGLVMDINRGTMGETFGSPAYISPEQARNSAGAVPQSDLYSMGVMLYEMLIGVVPFYDSSPAALALKHLTEEPPRPRDLNPRLSPAVEAVLLRALRKQPAERYATGREMMSALERALAPELHTQDASQPQPLPNETQVFRTRHVAPPSRVAQSSPAPVYGPTAGNGGVNAGGYPSGSPSAAARPGAAAANPRQTSVRSFDYANAPSQDSPNGTRVRPAYSYPSQPPPGYYPGGPGQPSYPAPPASGAGGRGRSGSRWFGCLGALLILAILAVFASAAAASFRLQLPSSSIAQLLAPLFQPQGPAAPAPSQTVAPTRTPVPSGTPLPPTPTNWPTPTQTTVPSPTPTNPPTATATATSAPSPTPTSPAAVDPNTYYLLLAHQKKDGFVLINTGEIPIPLAQFQLLDSNNKPVVSGADWEVDSLQPGQCVGVFITGSSPKVPSNVQCDPTGKVLMTKNRFWTNPVNIQYNNSTIATCPFDPSKCAISTKPQ